MDDDWAAFRSVYQRVTDRLPADARQAVAAGAMKAMVSALHDNHANWSHAIQPPKPYGLGFEFTPAPPVFLNAPAEALPPVYVTDVLGGPAAAAGLRPGDVIEAVDGAPLFVDGVPSIGALRLLDQEYPRGDRIRVTVRRPASGREWTVPMKPELFDPAPRPLVTAEKLGDIASVRLSGFAPQAADQVFAAIKNLGPVRGLVLDLRGNGGGSPVEVARLLGGFVHGKVISSWCDKSNTCTPNHTDDTVPLLDLPLVVLTSHDCASACEAFSSGVKDLKLGTLVGTRTAGLVSGPAGVYVLSDNSLIRMPSQHEKAANGEVVNGVGVAPDIFLPRTADDVSAGRDPALDKALLLLAH